MFMAAAMGAMSLMGALSQGEQQKQQNAMQRAQHAEKEYNRQLNNQIKNRNIAKANAAKWMQNIKIGEAASRARGEQEFWLKYNFDNASGQFSRQYQKVNSSIQTSLRQRNINPNSGTAQSILRQTLNTAKTGMTSRGVQFSNSLVSAERQQQQMLAKRDFGYQGQEKFIPGQLFQQSDSSIMQTALVSGVISGVSTGMAQAATQSFQGEQMQAAETQANLLGQQNEIMMGALNVAQGYARSGMGPQRP
jgi:hypothetical protein